MSDWLIYHSVGVFYVLCGLYTLVLTGLLVRNAVKPHKHYKLRKG